MLGQCICQVSVGHGRIGIHAAERLELGNGLFQSPHFLQHVAYDFSIAYPNLFD